MKSPASGFTLIELLVVITVIGILSAATIPSFNSFTQTQRLNQAAKQVKQDLRSAQNRALSSIEGKAWGVNVVNGNGYYTLFKCATSVGVVNYSLANCAAGAVTKNLPSGVTIQTPSFSNLVFNVVTGDLVVDGSLVSSGSYFLDLSLSGSTRRVTIYAGGRIEE